MRKKRKKRLSCLGCEDGYVTNASLTHCKACRAQRKADGLDVPRRPPPLYRNLNRDADAGDGDDPWYGVSLRSFEG